MKKIQIIKCKTCGKTYSACVDEYVNSDWYKQCAQSIAGGNAIVETIESDGHVFDGEPLNRCCGRTIKQIARFKEPLTLAVIKED